MKLANLRTGEVFYNNIKGEFDFSARIGDQIVAMSKEYFSDTLAVDNKGLLLFHLIRESIYIDEVQVSARKNPEEILKKPKKIMRRPTGWQDMVMYFRWDLLGRD
ncbi:hypothetical protein KUH03_19225 [Sphingobacterium sp. E70]|uniref:hypothetical protein n=1 Tax=Sphingobacterium sp. E70 TaxID=2853439 RepID=UPI00211CAAF7|nr:hypothetical protein [Sphingobacterium sp. E70]ULT28475.1 hypothetical protein KUH03_19225 [Sphingobacterium sp. E70]